MFSKGARTRNDLRRATAVWDVSLPKKNLIGESNPHIATILLLKIELGATNADKVPSDKKLMIDWHAPSPHCRGLCSPKTLRSNM